MSKPSKCCKQILAIQIAALVTSTCTVLGAPTVAHNKPSKKLSVIDRQENEAAKRGVDLIEHIVQKMHNSPQLAMSNARQSFNYRQQAQGALNAIADSVNLLIKPQIQRSQTQLAMAPAALSQAATYQNVNQGLSGATNGSIGAVELPGRVSPHIWEKSPREKDQAVNDIAAENREKLPENQQSDAFTPNVNEPLAGKQSHVISNHPLITEFNGNTAGDSSSLDKSLESAKNKSYGRLLAHGPARAVYGYEGGAAGARTDFPSAPPTLKMFGPLSIATTINSASAPVGNLKVTVKKSELKSDLRNSFDRKETEIAWSPPTVITGIPAVRLGAAQKELAHSLTSLGSLHKDNIENWSVWSLTKAKAHSCALQVFLKHGIVEAMRVYDQSLLPTDIGIALGDELGCVKQRFGEPAFILPEFSSSITQNYIYPISQIDFQLGRLPHEQMPKILSVLIFNVR